MGCHWHGVKFIATNLCLKRRRMSNNPLPWHTGKEKQTQPRTRRERERTKITGAINEIKKRKTEQINKCCSFEKINPVDRPLATVTQKKRIEIQERQKKVQKEWHGNQGKKVFQNTETTPWCEMLLKYQEIQAYVCQIQGCRGVKQSGKPAYHNWRGQGEGNTERKKERVSRGGGSSQVWRAYIPC